MFSVRQTCHSCIGRRSTKCTQNGSKLRRFFLFNYSMDLIREEGRAS